MDHIPPSQIHFETDDHVTLTGNLFRSPDPDKIIVISGATGVPEKFYHRFANWLAAERNAIVLTFTYRDMHDTSPKAMRASEATMEDWGITDGQAARDAARAAHPALPLWVIGHSLGGMMVSKQPRLDGITRLITVASGLVDHRAHPMPYRALVFAFWFLLGPISTRLCGYLPGKTIGLGATLPARVFWQWRSWCTSGPDGFLAVDGIPVSDWTRSGAPVRLVGIRDDSICTPEMAFSLAKAYAGGSVDTLELDPAEHGARKLGHFGVFTSAGKPWWPALVD